MKEQIIPGLTASPVSEVYCPEYALSSDSSVVCDPTESPAADPPVPMSNLELLGNVAFAMSRTDDIDDGLDEPVVLSTSTGGVVITENNGQIPGSSVVYFVPAGDDEAAQSFAAVIQQSVEAAADGESLEDNDCAPGISGITNAASVYFRTLPDGYDALCNVEPLQFNVPNVKTAASELNNDIASTCLGDEASAAGTSTTDSGFAHIIDMSLDSFSLSMLTNAVTS